MSTQENVELNEESPIVREYLSTTLERDPEGLNPQLGLTLKINTEPPTLDLVVKTTEKEGFLPKEEFHVTIVGRDMLEYINNQLVLIGKPPLTPLDYDAIEHLAREIVWRVPSVSDPQTLYKVTKPSEQSPERASIVQLLEMPAMEDFFKRLYARLGFPRDRIPGIADDPTDSSNLLKVPLPHITLAYRVKPIGIISRQDFESLGPVTFQEAFPSENS